MLPCDEVQELAEEYVSDTLDPERYRQVAAHLRVCEPCHRLMDEARLARRVLEETGLPPPPPSLAESIKHAAHMRLRHRPRPLHERALGSPAFLAICASLACGAVICLLAILKVGSVQPWPETPPPQVSVVARMVLPTRDGVLTARPVTVAATAREDTRAHHHVSPSLAAVPARAPSVSSPARITTVAVTVWPQRALTPFVHSAPSLSLTPTLPEAALVPAAARISVPESVRPLPRTEPTALRSLLGGPETETDRLDLSDIAAPQPPRADFTGTR